MADSRLDAALEVQRAMFPPGFADNAMKNASEFSKPFFVMMAEQLFGEIWTRPGLSRRDRSLITVAMLTVLNRSEELQLHVPGAIANGVTRDEIREVLLQAMGYGGVPYAVAAFKSADEALKKLDAADAAKTA
ncbi:4-carboxymuconolactone decarboxylase [Sphingomonas paucimobilis]|uniref:carboxymuconolactone decarboxylase family protein n=1 Tax=Sphingobium sp. DC-2 TaxID=1303256 RepID=UPI0004539B00|nr:carboxymuconolactone decarboxylase family protein [Sphingobium sp. DC-2]EZP74556.1 4-carboxymuconolactone decarboxylase [Sphingomonas paucimobilis]